MIQRDSFLMLEYREAGCYKFLRGFNEPLKYTYRSVHRFARYFVKLLADRTLQFLVLRIERHEHALIRDGFVTECTNVGEFVQPVHNFAQHRGAVAAALLKKFVQK